MLEKASFCKIKKGIMTLQNKIMTSTRAHLKVTELHINSESVFQEVAQTCFWER